MFFQFIMKKNIEHAYEEIRKIMHKAHIDFELVYVDDGSRDKSFEIIQRLAGQAKEGRIIGLSFLRNFGKEAAIFHDFPCYRRRLCGNGL